MEYETARDWKDQVHQSHLHLQQLSWFLAGWRLAPLQVSFGAEAVRKGTWIERNLWGNDIVKVKAVLSRVMPFLRFHMLIPWARHTQIFRRRLQKLVPLRTLCILRGTLYLTLLASTRFTRLARASRGTVPV